MIYFFAAYRAMRRALAEDQHRPPRSPVPLWRLVLGEIALLAARVGRWRVTAVAMLVGVAVLLVEVALSDATPGPALAAPWRWVLAVAVSSLAVAAWAVVHAVRSSGVRPTR